ncbi:MAG TPA: YbaB/EbfC family nucleoid-associated protein [Candidatus Onthousia faecipullorum]|uniref:Nucleoid-associated protein IAB59_02460 n=1 Tax=Candidatus Onthousia faecipullorum TaxID=2840887 RepID=A0A9D1GB71_9FIRM|nr:YbaB/EbfC family nucleoid-associated protein [Candidatus Onthousia faecipullorum]
MNIQAMMKQAQKLQSDMMKVKDEIDKMEFSSTNGLVTVKINGKKEVLEVKIENDSDFSSDDLEMLQDMIVIATNDAMKQVDKITEEKMGRFSSIPGLF